MGTSFHKGFQKHRSFQKQRGRIMRVGAQTHGTAWTQGALRWVGVVWLLLSCTGCLPTQPDELVAEDGFLTVQPGVLERVVALGGEWRAYAGADSVVFASYDYDDSHWQRVAISDDFKAQGFPDEGLVYYRLHLRLPPNAPPVMGFIQHTNNAHTLYVAQPRRPPVLAASSGRPGLTPDVTERSRAPVNFQLPADTSLVLTWKVANHDYLNGGAFHRIQIGMASAYHRHALNRTIALSVQGGFYLLIVVFFVLSWLWYSQDVQSLVVALLSGVIALRSLTVAGAFEFFFPDVVTFDTRILLEAVTFFSMIGLFGLLIWSFLPRLFVPVTIAGYRFHPPSDLVLHRRGKRIAPLKVSKQVRRTFTWLLVLSLGTASLLLALSLFNQPLLTSYLFRVGRWVVTPLLAISIVILAFGVWSRQPLGTILIAGFVPVFFTGLHDVLYAAGLVEGSGTYLVGYGFLLFILVQCFAVARRNAHNADLARQNAELFKMEVNRQTQELREAAEAAQTANRAKSQFLSAVSHELRSPLASILGYTRLLQEQDADAPSEEFLEAIQDNANRLMRLVNDVLDAVRVETNAFSFVLAPVSVRALIDEVVASVHPVVRQKKLTLTVEVELPHMEVQADADRLRQVLLNVLSNAVKFTETGEVTVRASEASLSGVPACAIAVRDTGPGISPSFLPQLFKPFSQEPRTYRQALEGTGLGLSISQELVRRMHGEITVDSVLGEGSVFTVFLPLAVEDPSDAETPQEEPMQVDRAVPKG